MYLSSYVMGFPRDACHHFMRGSQRKSHGNISFTSCENTSSVVGSVRYAKGCALWLEIFFMRK